MAAARQHVDEGDLNFVFKRLGERGKEAELMKKINEHVNGPTSELLTEHFMELTENQVIIRHYGSAAEDLKCLSPDDYGDTDIMVFPSSEVFLIHEEMVDHPLESPLHVRIRASDHPVLQSCLVEGTEYLATSALKNFHPAIYGNKVSKLFDCLTNYAIRAFSKDDPKQCLPIVASWKNEKTSPAFSVHGVESIATLHQQLQNMTETKRLHSLNSAEWEWTWAAACEAMGVEYTREHAAVLDDFLQHASELQESLTKRGIDGILEGYPAYLQEIMSCDAVEKFKALVEATESRSPKETSLESDRDDHSRESEGKLAKQLLCHSFGRETEVKEPSENDTAHFKRKTGLDLVPALKSRGWPKSARDWIKRERKWPSVEMVTKIIDEGYHLVVKSPKYSEIPECDFRISFSHAEYLLSQEMNEIQRECYRCLKKLHRAYLSSPAGLVSFHLKNLFLQTIEETGTEMWTADNRAECMMKLLQNLLKALKGKDLPHFFVRSYNLFGVDYIVKPENLTSLAEEMEKIMENPLDFSQALIQQSEDKKKIQKETFEKESKPGVPLTSGHGRAAEPRGSNENRLPNHRYHDLQDMYLQVGKELAEKALNGDEIHDPLERPLVEGFKEMIQSHDFQTEYFLELLRKGWSYAYFRICLSTELEMRRRMLDAIRGDVETWKYLSRQEDLLSGDMEDIVNRMLNPSHEDRFDLSNLVPAGGTVQFMRMFFNSLDNMPLQQAHVQVSQDFDDVPLD